jgi:hypothetical protein
MNSSRKALFFYTLPILLSSLSEHLLLLTDVYLLSFQETVFLAAVGFVDAFLLCSLSLGFALNDSFQNFYARNTKNKAWSYAIYQHSLRSFVLLSILVSGIAFFIVWMTSFTLRSPVYTAFFEASPFIIPLILASFLSLSMNAYLLANDKVKAVGLISFVIILSNALLGYLFLYVLRLPFSPLHTILISSLVAELIGIICMHLTIQQMKPDEHAFPIKKAKKLFQLLHVVALYPALSEFLFHAGSFLLFVFCSFYFSENEIAQITLLLAYWGVLMVPVETFSETGLNQFARIFAEKQKSKFLEVKNKLFQTSSLVACVLFSGIFLMDFLLIETSTASNLDLFILLVIVIVAAHNQLMLTAMLTKLQTRSYGITKALYGLTVIGCLCALVFAWKASTTAVILSFLGGQLVVYAFLQLKKQTLL